MAYVSVSTNDEPVSLAEPSQQLTESKLSNENVFLQDIGYSKVPTKSENFVISSTAARHPCRPPWIPYTLRVPFLTFMTVVSLSLCAITAVLTGYSKHHDGLGNDDGSSGLLFGWRFTPTIVAVIYARLIAMVFNDFRRTEPFARMARSPTSASNSVFHVPGAWWKMLAEAFSRKKNGGAINWPLANATTVFVIASLIISSMSASFLTTGEITLLQTLPLQRRTLPTNASLKLQASPDVFLGTTGSIIYNLSVDPWTLGEYTVLPFWHEGADAADMLRGIGGNKTESLKTETSVFRTEYNCKTMNATISLNNTRGFSATGHRNPVLPGHDDTILINGTSKMDTTTLLSDSGCRFQIDMAPMMMANRVNSAVWGRALDPLDDIGQGWTAYMDSENTTQAYVYVPGPYTYSFYQYSGPGSPFLRYNGSTACADKDIIHLSTQLVDTSNDVVKTLQGNYSQKAWECQLEITTAEIPVKFSQSQIGSVVTFDREEFERNYVQVGDEVLNGTEARRLLHQSNWLSYLNPAHYKTDHSALLLSAEYQYDFNSMISDDEIPRKAQAAMETFLASLLQSSLAGPNASETRTTSGTSARIVTRVEVFQGTGIALSVLYGICALFLAALAWQCGTTRRSLNLKSNPSTTEGIADLIASGQWNKAAWKPLFIASSDETRRCFQSTTYSTDPKLQEHDQTSSLKSNDTSRELKINTSVHEWKPTTLRITSLIGLAIYLILIAIGISILYDYSTGNRLYQSLFVNQVELGEISGHVARFTPFSIVPTFLAVILGMWWDGIHQKFCQLQPFNAMTQPGGAPWKDGPGMHYSATNWIKSSSRAARNRHWLLFFVIIGNIMCQIFVITASALFARENGYKSTETRLNITTDLRRLPMIASTRNSFSVSSDQFQNNDTSVLSSADLERIVTFNSDYGIYWTKDSTWLYSATNQIVHGADEPAWSKDGWAFTPVELSEVTNNQSMTVMTQAIRARATCSSTSQSYQVSHEDSWLLTYDLTDKNIWNTSANPQGIERGYFIGNYTLYGTPFYEGNGLQFCASGSNALMTGAMWNDYSVGMPGRFPYRFSQWPINFTAAWMQGAAQSGFFLRDNFTLSSRAYDERIYPATYGCADTQTRLNLSMFTEVPKFQSVDCQPVIEIASARVTVGQDGGVSNFELMEDPKPYNDPWKDVFVSYTHNSSDAGQSPNDDYQQNGNVTSSYGIYFLSSLLKAPQIGYVTSDDETNVWTFDSIYPNYTRTGAPFFIREDQSGMDLMSYCMHYLADKNTTALLTNTTLYSELVDKTIGTFFAHFATGDTDAMPRRVYQQPGDRMPDLGKKVVFDEKTKTLKQEDPETYPPAKPDATVDARLDHRVQLLRMNHVATWLSFGILVSLLLITIAISFLHRRFLSPLHRNIESMADVMLLVAGSDHLLTLVKDHGIEALRQDENLLVRLGWFRSETGKLRWGIEVVDSGDADAGIGQGLGVVWEDESGSRTQSKWERVSTGLSNLSLGKRRVMV
ncbi:uncharacterized protein CC84DRAFT_1259792 [Paraphaeosphaeria sporulosa]|uniref:Uncharacterized protein n=1 Tax=Paraphaeosphaeria sporulosa TaxID=1460663 RepID=A0A177CC63_9PLEO|nr:uncharacterized protein CC84DRAFT_1259792 [Paraphaeosphaeria sporulosa]OAG04389.1 hypothetical protein CC84DRAFT_1259792 [Paraphaeosphaeria sporulosa]